MAGTTQHLLGLVQGHTPRRFGGDALLFLATEGRPELLSLDAARGIWEPWIAGEVTGVEVDTDHDGLLRAASAAAIGRAVTERLGGADHDDQTNPTSER
jgi:hypothetical protein